MFDDNDEPDIVHLQRISRETVEYLRSMKKDLSITTGKIESYIVRKLQQMHIQETLAQHNERIGNIEQSQSTVKNALIRGLTQVIKTISGDNHS